MAITNPKKKTMRIEIGNWVLVSTIRFPQRDKPISNNMIFIENIVKTACPSIRLGCLRAAVEVKPSSPALLKFTEDCLEQLQRSLTLEKIHAFPALHATREAYKALGKDPSRYRPSAEALLRRVVQGKGLYQVNNVVDTLNLISIQTGFSIGGYDFDKIKGNIRLGSGEEGEPYQVIGRGELNIHNLPILRDGTGAFGSPTSDSERTMVTPATKRFLAVFFDFGSGEVEAALQLMAETLNAHLNAKSFEFG